MPRELTHSQRQIWIGQEIDPESPLYNMAFAFVVSARLRPDLFCRAWRRVTEASDALRTRIVEEGGVRRPVIAASAPPTEVVDFSEKLDPEDAFRRFCHRRCRRPLALGERLVESALVRLGGEATGWYLNQHHLITDAFSTRLLVSRVGAEYEALAAEAAGAAGLPPLADYYPTVADLASRFPVSAEALEHWRARRAGPGRRVPLYGREGEAATTASRRTTRILDEERTGALRALAGERGWVSLSPEISRFTLFATLLAAWLHRVSGRRRVGFDAPVAGRPTPEAKRALGLFIEMFPFAVAVAPGDSFRSLGARCLEESLSFLRYALPGTSSPSAVAAGNVVLNYFPFSLGSFAGLPLDVEWVHSGHGDRVHALRLQVHDFAASGRTTLHFDANRELLPERLQRRVPVHFERLLEACLEDPDRPIGEVELTTEGERRALAAFNATDSRPAAVRTVIERFQEVADRHPERVALRQGGRERTFGELRVEVESLAAALVDRGLRPGDRVAVTGRRSIESVVAILGVLRGRGAYVPIEAGVPSARLEELVRDAGVRLLLTAAAGDTATGPADLPTLSVADGVRAGAGAEAGDGPELDDLAYLIYTSGSTGRPKGVMIGHDGLADYLGWAERTYVRGRRLAYPLFTSLAVDLTVTSLFLPLATGGFLEIHPEPEGPADSALLAVAEADGVDFLKLTPSHLSLLVRMGFESSRLRSLVVGGERLPTGLAAAAARQLGGKVEIYNEYGPTEAVVGCVAHRFDPESDTGDEVPIGAPADHVRAQVLDPWGLPSPEGVPGELWISRIGLARGYLGRPALTADRFRPDPERRGGRRYRTGDRVRFRGPGTLEYLGRLDRQVKISGYRVEPGEIEAALLQSPGVEACAVVARRRSRPRAGAGAGEERASCLRCGLPSSHPRAVLDGSGVCGICRSYETIESAVQEYFGEPEELRRIFGESAREKRGEYDCMMLLSGGKDSTYALCRLVEMGLSVYAFTLDNGYISEHAKENVRRVTGELGVPVEMATTPAMNEIFRDSLRRFSNVCNGCFKTVYTLSLRRARELEIPILVTGLSRGQLFETRLSEEMFRDGRFSPEEVDAAVLAARKVYHRLDDQVSRSLGGDLFADDRIFQEVQIVDFYRYFDVPLEEVYAYLERKVSWVRPRDTGRSTNCLINDVGIYVHRKERGFHNYALPYSWDVRLGHKDRKAALEELVDEIDSGRVREILEEIGYQEEDRDASDVDPVVLHAFYVAGDGVTEAVLRRHLEERLPAPLVPAHLERLEALPLTAAGKVDAAALTAGLAEERPGRPYRPPQGPVAEHLAEIWRQELGVERVGADDDFFELGGTSLGAMEVMIRLCREYDLDLPLESLFSNSTLGALARVAEERILGDVAAWSEDDRSRFLAET